MKTILVAGGLSLLLALFGTPLAIRVFSRRGYGQLIREEGPAGHATKRGTPTMGGTVIVVASLAGYFAGNVATGQVPSISGLLVMMLMTALTAVAPQMVPPGPRMTSIRSMSSSSVSCSSQ